jgi:hypothetical protein
MHEFYVLVIWLPIYNIYFLSILAALGSPAWLSKAPFPKASRPRIASSVVRQKYYNARVLCSRYLAAYI